MQSKVQRSGVVRAQNRRYIYIACPWTPVGGGMFKVADYLIQAQAYDIPEDAAELRPLDTRGSAHAFFSFWVLFTALIKLVRGRLSGALVGVHVNMAERLSLFRKSTIVVACKALGIPVVLHLHAAQLHHFYGGLPKRLQNLTRWVFSLPESVIVLGQSARRFVIEELQVPQERVEIVINGVPAPTEQRVSASSRGGVRRLLFLGNLSERKGVTDLLKALGQAHFENGLEVTIAGGGDVPHYQAIARDLGIDNFVLFKGWADQKKVAELMRKTDALVLPSYDEGLPLVILEALANSVAVICSPVGEIPSVLTDRVDAYFVAPGDIRGIAHGLQEVLSQPDLLLRLQHNGRALYEREFALTKFFSSVANIHQIHFGFAGRPLKVFPKTQDTR